MLHRRSDPICTCHLGCVRHVHRFSLEHWRMRDSPRLLQLCLDRDNLCLDGVWDDLLERVRDKRDKLSSEQQQQICQFHPPPRLRPLVFQVLAVWSQRPVDSHCALPGAGPASDLFFDRCLLCECRPIPSLLDRLPKVVCHDQRQSWLFPLAVPAVPDCLQRAACTAGAAKLETLSKGQ